jgi:hypothetical protein
MTAPHLPSVHQSVGQGSPLGACCECGQWACCRHCATCFSTVGLCLKAWIGPVSCPSVGLSLSSLKPRPSQLPRPCLPTGSYSHTHQSIYPLNRARYTRDQTKTFCPSRRNIGHSLHTRPPGTSQQQPLVWVSCCCVVAAQRSIHGSRYSRWPVALWANGRKAKRCSR